ncbi:MAG: hypothetical protein ACKV2V_30880 [Blastocatellia bacterium]
MILRTPSNPRLFFRAFVRRMPAGMMLAIAMGCLFAARATVRDARANPAPPRATADKTPRAEEIVEKVILVYGSRPMIYGVQRNGIIRSNVKLFSGNTARDAQTVTKFMRRKKVAEDLLLLELDLPDFKYVLGFNGEKHWATSNGADQEPDEATVRGFRNAHAHSYETLLRYKENDAKLEYVNSDKIGTLEMDIIDVVMPDGERTRYTISHRSFRILFLEYEAKGGEKAEPAKYRLAFSDFRAIQNTLVPWQVVVYQNGQKVEERKLTEVAYNVRMEETLFRAKPAENAEKPADSEKPAAAKDEKKDEKKEDRKNPKGAATPGQPQS